RRCACADLRCLNQQRTRRPDKAFMPPSGYNLGTASDVYRPAALRLHGTEDEETPAGDHLRPLRPKQYHRVIVPSGQHGLMEI
ncbi:hypothetical protein J4734_04775, partial [Klebsiella pneumoniae]|nr:hypothetical protein [Klebsiella pneumoniae]